MFNRELLKKSVEQYGILLSDGQCEMFEKYSSLLREWNEKINLTAILDEDEIIIKHFSDSLSIYPYIKQYIDKISSCGGLKERISFIDVGTGAGFPGIPVKIIFPDISLTLLDSTEKKIKFLNVLTREMSFNDCRIINMRAEEAGKDFLYREKYDICAARAVAKLPVLLELCMPFIKLNGIFIALKGIGEEEIKESQGAVKLLGGEIMLTNKLNLYKDMGSRMVLIIKKIEKLPVKYPRKFISITNNPIKN